MNIWLNRLLPRFVTEEVALAEGPDGGLYPICTLADVQPDEIPDAVATFRSFNFFNVALFPQVISEPRPFTEKDRLHGN